MDRPNVQFSYNTQKDIENIMIGLGTIKKGRSADREMRNIIDCMGDDPSISDLESYINNRLSNKNDLINISIYQTQEWWNQIEKSYFDHVCDRMQVKSFGDIKKLNGYFSLRHGSGYSESGNWFAVSLHDSAISNGATAMHEIMHIIFHKDWWNFCIREGLSEKSTWDVKESATVLLNLWFGKLMINPDLGYEEHAELRCLIKKIFIDTRDFKKTLVTACKFAKNNQEKSPLWV